MSASASVRIKAMIALMCLFFAVAFMVPATAFAQDSGKTVRVGWYESSFNTTDQFGRRSGYAYEYQMKLSAYTGWTLEGNIRRRRGHRD